MVRLLTNFVLFLLFFHGRLLVVDGVVLLMVDAGGTFWWLCDMVTPECRYLYPFGYNTWLLDGHHNADHDAVGGLFGPIYIHKPIVPCSRHTWMVVELAVGTTTCALVVVVVVAGTRPFVVVVVDTGAFAAAVAVAVVAWLLFVAVVVAELLAALVEAFVVVALCVWGVSVWVKVVGCCLLFVAVVQVAVETVLLLSLLQQHRFFLHTFRMDIVSSFRSDVIAGECCCVF